MQRALIQYRRPENYALVKEALLKLGRTDLIGYDKNCLIPPRPWSEKKSGKKDEKSRGKQAGRQAGKQKKQQGKRKKQKKH